MSKSKPPTTGDIPGYPICPDCGSRFRQAKGDEHIACPECRVSDLAYGERLGLGFSMLNQDEYDNH